MYTTNKEINTPDDLKGLKIRVQTSETNVKMLEALGASATPMSFGEVYTGLQQGVIDGAENNELALINNKHGEVAKYYSYTMHLMQPDIVIMSTHLKNSLTDEEEEIFKNSRGIIVPGGFGNRGIEGMINALKYARENNIPCLGICLGMQLMVIEFMRNVVGLKDANSLEFSSTTKNPVINIMEDQINVENKGGTMRLGKYPCTLDANTKAFEAYKDSLIYERHRHRFEFNNDYRDMAIKNGLNIVGTSPDNKLVEMVEVSNNLWMVGSQFHPELKSRPNRPHPLFRNLVKYSKIYKESKVSKK